MSDPTFMEGKATTAYMEDFFARTPVDLFTQ
jgi:acetyl-CoA carboxylase biotin carboxylase subunit